jgi:hypothetical protein
VNLAIYDMAGKKVGTYEIDPAELAPEVNKQLLHDAVVMYQANARQGTQKTKTRARRAPATPGPVGVAAEPAAAVAIFSPSGPATLVGECRGRPSKRPRGWRWQRGWRTTR